jgi:hypothetical protein
MSLWVLNQYLNSLFLIHHKELFANLLEEVNPCCWETEHLLEESIITHLLICVCAVNAHFLSSCDKKENWPLLVHKHVHWNDPAIKSGFDILISHIWIFTKQLFVNREHDWVLFCWSNAIKDDAVIVLNTISYIAASHRLYLECKSFMNDVIAWPFHHTSFIFCLVELKCHWLRERIDIKDVQQNVPSRAFISFTAFFVDSSHESEVFSRFVELNS